MNTIKGIEILNDADLIQFERFVSIPTILFNQEEVFYLNDSCKQMLGCGERALQKTDMNRLIDCFGKVAIAKTIHNTLSPMKREILISKMSKEQIWVEYIGKVVMYRAQKCIFAHLADISDLKIAQLHLSRISGLRALMLEVSQSILKTENIDHMFRLILKNALKALEKGSLGTILKKEKECFIAAASVGFDEDIKDFCLPIEDAFLYKATNGRMDRIANIPDLMVYDSYHYQKTTLGEEKYIKSTISAPIYHKDSLFGMINIDSVEKNAFDEDDIKSMEFIRNNVEIAVSNHLLYMEKVFLAKYDPLTHLYNRFYFEEQFEIIKEKALRYNETFRFAMFDIDELKHINDSLGHLAGDLVIKRIAQQMRAVTRKSDVLARFGGDEFIGIFYHSTALDLQKKFLSLLTKLKKEPLAVNGNFIMTSFSFGVVSFPEEGIHLDDLIKIADERMYAFKKSAGNKF